MGTGWWRQRALGRGRRWAATLPNQLGYLRFERRALARLHGYRDESREHFQMRRSAAAEVCARSSDGSALVGLLLPLAATTHLRNDAALPNCAGCARGYPKRACNRLSMALDSGAIPVFGVLLLINPVLFHSGS